MKKYFKYILPLIIASCFITSCEVEETIFSGPYHARFTSASAAIGENSTGSVTIPLHLVAPKQSQAVTITVAVADGSTSSSNFTLSSNTATIAAGEFTTSISLTPVDNTEADGTKVVRLEVVSVEPASFDAGFGMQGKFFTVNITDDDCPNLAKTYDVVNTTCTGDGAGGCGSAQFEIETVVTLTRVQAGVYSCDDLSFGLYPLGYGDGKNPGQITEGNCGVLSIPNQPDVVYGGDFFNGPGAVAADGTITITWSNGYGDQGTAILTPQ